MLFPIRTDTPLRRTPYANWALICINVVCFIAQMSVSQAKWSPLMLHPRDPQLWQYITYQFLHHDVLHIAGNMLFLYVFGGNVCDKIGGAGYVAFYLAGGVMAG